MEWNLRLNWSVIIQEAKQRRKKQKLTQAKLAQISGVSTPTISRFENGEKDIQLSSVISILEMLGMVDKRELIFTDLGDFVHEPFYDPLEMVIWFRGKDDNKEILCGITHGALVDYFGGSQSPDKLKAFLSNREAIEHEARRKYIAGKLEPNGRVMVKSEDL